MKDNYLVRKGQRYRRTLPGDIYESQVQALVHENAIALFPTFECLRFEPYFKTPAGDVQPDLVLVKRDRSGWGLVEVEIDTHSFTSHVLPQVNKLTWARGDSVLAATLAGQSSILEHQSLDSIEGLISVRPSVFLVTHGASTRARDRLNRLGIHQYDIDILRNLDSPNDAQMIVTDHTIDLRALPSPALRSTSPLTRQAWTLQLESIDALPWISTHAAVTYDGMQATWRARRTSDGLILSQPPSASGLEDKLRMLVRVDETNQIIHLEDGEQA